MEYTDQLLAAIGAWQNGWGEDARRRLAITGGLREAISRSYLPDVAKQAIERCYRKRYLVPNNPQNGGDLKPLIVDGRIEEGVASWTTEFDCAKGFKDPTRLNSISVIFSHTPSDKEVLLNVKALWSLPDFVKAVNVYADKGGEYAAALQNFRARQSEVILDAPVLIEEVEAFCERSSGFEHLCDIAGLTAEEQREDFWRRMVAADVFPGDVRWLDRDGARRVLEKVRRTFVD